MFRLDINGLRFIAVAMVVLFHFKIGYFYGGYAGVDVFFVISGFLMSEICKNKVGTKEWVIDFYKKRFKRIYPALAICVLFSFLLAITSTPPSMLKGLFYQVISALTFTSNLYYLKATSGYFTDAADSFVFLHTWSLSVEWQFYLVFPLLLFLASKVTRKFGQVIFYLILVLISFSICILLTKYNQIYSFYLLPSRAWELLIGVLASTVNIKNRAPRITEAVCLFVLIAFTAVVKESSNWPGFETLIPTLATAFLLHANVGNEKTLLRAKPLQFIGSCSYSIYLFHWPVVFWYYLNNIEFNFFNQLIGIIVSVILGYLSYSYIERNKSFTFFKLVLIALSVSAISLVSDKISITKFWMSKEILAMDRFHIYSSSDEGLAQFGNAKRICFLTSGFNNASNFSEDKCLVNNPSNNKPRLLLIGDSHAAEFYQAAKEYYPNHLVMQVTSSGCMPFIEAKGEKRCVDLMRGFYQKYINKYKFDIVLISANWVDGRKYYTDRQMVENIKHSVSILNAHSQHVFVLGQTKVFDTPFYRIALSGDPAKILRHELIEP
ncbi:TPA: acyltransferase, partial [Klebsiella pneumoniae]|nr:acyltransferase [Klebsiella pneumoniae]